MTAIADDLKKEIQQKEAELAALKNKLYQICPADPATENVKKEPLETENILLSVYKSEEDPNNYEKEYLSLQEFIDGNLDYHKLELSTILFPVFVHMYLELVYNKHTVQARRFYERFKGSQQQCHGLDLIELSVASTPEYLANSRLVQTYRSNKSSIIIYKDSFNRLKKFLTESKLTSVIKVISDHLSIDVCDGSMRSKVEVEMQSSALLGNPPKDCNKSQMFYGLLKDTSLQLDDEEEDTAATEDDRPKKKKAKKETSSVKKLKVDPNSPHPNRIPLPEMKETDKLERLKLRKELSKKVNLRENPTTIFYFTAHNLPSSITSMDMSEDSSTLAAGLLDSSIKVWSVNGGNLAAMKGPDDLDLLDKESEDIMERIMDEKNAPNNRTLHGHSGPVYSCSLSQDKNYMVSCSEDGTIRLWYLPLWTNVVCYHDCKLPQWDAKISPMGHYFASCGEEGNASLWSMDQHRQLRLFVGHMSVVKCLEFHPNCNYVATGSDDRTVRVWDVLNGECVRVFKGHKDSIGKIAFSHCGRYLASTGRDRQVFVWDLANGEHIYRLRGHNHAVKSLTFSRDDSVLASGSLDGIIKIWDVNKVSSSNVESDHFDTGSGPNGQLEIGSFRTKNSPVLNLHFTRRNLLIASGPFLQPYKLL